jgi:hypothetical protein
MDDYCTEEMGNTFIINDRKNIGFELPESRRFPLIWPLKVRNAEDRVARQQRRNISPQSYSSACRGEP